MVAQNGHRRFVPLRRLRADVELGDLHGPRRTPCRTQSGCGITTADDDDMLGACQDRVRCPVDALSMLSRPTRLFCCTRYGIASNAGRSNLNARLTRRFRTAAVEHRAS